MAKKTNVGSFYGRGLAVKVDVDTEVSNMGIGETLDLITIPAGTLVQGVTIDIQTVEGGVATIKIGDAADDAGFIAAADANVLGFTGSFEGAAAYVKGKIYAEDTVLVLTAIAALSKTVAKVTYYGFDLT